MKHKIYLLLLLLLISSVNAQYYNTTGMSDQDTLYGQTYELNLLLFGLVGIGLILIVFAITFVVVFGNTANVLSGLLAASFWATVTSTIMLPLGIIGFPIFQGLLLLFSISLGARILIRG